MTYRDLIVALSKCSTEQLGMDITIYDAETDEFHRVNQLVIKHNCDVLDEDHPYLIIKEDE